MPLQWTFRGALGVIDDRIGGMQGSGVAGDAIDSKLAGYRARLAAPARPDGVMRELSDFDRVLGSSRPCRTAGAAVRAGRISAEPADSASWWKGWMLPARASQ